ncbi:pentapeptide repeat-containing protein [Numidum massiliense]|uniref:pentapeptide repeat-containing protein n=1 Tax=Numidum massiliense TaxID=1522315 RepID=UPI0006D58425|nr:pentapeptide repeat-containing protein [Numidum massiliense]
MLGQPHIPREDEDQRVVLEGEDFTEADLRFANAQETTFEGANLGHVQWEGADLLNADLRGATLAGMDLRHVNLKGAVMSKRQALTLLEPFVFSAK